MSKPAAKYAPGDRVIRTSWPAGETGVMVKQNPKTALVRFDGGSKDERVDLDSIRPETAEDIAKRERKAADEAWRSAQPKTKHITIARSSGWYTDAKIIGVEARLSTPTEMRTAAQELLELADWFERRPKETP